MRVAAWGAHSGGIAKPAAAGVTGWGSVVGLMRPRYAVRALAWGSSRAVSPKRRAGRFARTGLLLARAELARRANRVPRR